MGLFSFLGEWGAEAGKIYESDKTIEVLTGINPKHLQPELYKNSIKFPHEVAQGVVESTAYDKPDLTSDEVAALRLSLLLLVYDKHEEYGAAQKFADGLGRLLRTRSRTIRQVFVDIIENDICYGLRTTDSNPSGKPRPQQKPPPVTSTPPQSRLVISEIDRRSQIQCDPQLPVHKELPPAFTASPKTVLSAKDREIISDLKLSGWTVAFNGKSWTLRKGEITHQLFDVEELRIIAKKSMPN